MKKNISRNPLWPDWYNGKKIDEVQLYQCLTLLKFVLCHHDFHEYISHCYIY